jgi:hypothetical protein
LWDEKFKFFLLTLIFSFLGITAAIGIFYMDEIMSLLGFEDFPMIVTPSSQIVFLDFFGDFTLFGLLIMSLGSMNLFASDIESGAICFSLSRPISRRSYTISKMIVRVLALTLPLVLASFITWSYIGFVFEILPIDQLIGALLPLVLLFLYMGFLSSFFSSRFSTVNAGFVTIGVLIAQFAISIFEPLELLSPFALSSFWADILSLPSWQFNSEILRKYFFLICWLLLPFFATVFSMEKRDL